MMSQLIIVYTIIKEYAEKDKRIKAVIRYTNISVVTNCAISLAEREFIAFLDHDDELSMGALFYILKTLNNYPNAKIVYSDEDKIDEQGRRSWPHMKPDWNLDLFLSQNYISHLCVIKASLVRAVGCLRKGVEGSQDYDLLLRCIPKITDQEIIHIPRILYHWRAIETSTAYSTDAKNYTTASGLKALQDCVQSIGSNSDVSPGSIPNTYVLSYSITSPAPLISIIIPTRDNARILRTGISRGLHNRGQVSAACNFVPRTHNPRLLERGFRTLERCTGNSFRGTLTRKKNRRSRHTVRGIS